MRLNSAAQVAATTEGCSPIKHGGAACDERLALLWRVGFPAALCALASYCCCSTCCGGEWLLAVPGIGVLHVGSMMAARTFSLAFPITVALYFMAYILVRCLLRPRHALVFSIVAVPCALRGPLGDWVMGQFAPNPAFQDEGRTLEFVEHLRQSRSSARARRYRLPLVGQLDTSLARHAAQVIHAHRDDWTIHLGCFGTPHFQLGFRYDAGWQSNRYVKSSSVDITSDIEIWSELGDLFEALRRSIEDATGSPTRLHKEVNPPAFLLNLPFVLYRPSMHPEVHRDPLGPRGVLDSNFSMCNQAEQMTLTLTLETQRGDGTTGIDLWKYSDDEESCPSRGSADPSCMVHEFYPYREGGFVLFPSSHVHATSHGRPPWWGTATRAIMVAFVVPCGDGEERELHVVPTAPRRRMDQIL